MSSQLKDLTSKYQSGNNQFSSHFNDKKVNVTELIEKLKIQKKREKNKNILLSAAAISAASLFAIILTL